ncbi:2-C-methyl-D-erythritol 4-phosphate cytidylyltransferase [Synechococcus elongatus]|uniref:2-C-methyl-D-erythritol 4-phosphate cytidylyltransferase n=1 Tax=Synechococcus elongatus (strain ATCC 33912 / PCC 7942 / FACHB-805) TaxID=1140 RepID=ISPD_SYNE7|nr:2-C-methyl-D-erythritol 4-phosphate cytidylyltransferase [Synechococcus elongatus]Q31QF6.1 RecName: Full=2-C-methyl-D-erythritol 4-phosphate cytidylyltransferase; AltName: Full=4-diphosphocytidyl-2C-methyl-D-erythritol synthase; AltName: Full=MEP cytidylyltransferase; Short=MCT [Synechococcus elongatus PCC 7942 = FACHB-805]ABB56713.1 2-C-methyl-D-erythritol 4-phosphate cytidylyltransferase [Synechococcus elongatus PCC 7942 = FACHB-805]AJD58745.1 2-C-methyl-D-erythritol 4-phosphate cytidylyltr
MHLLIPAAGSGRRFGADRNKLLLPLLGQPVLAWTLQAADQAQSITWIGIIGQPGDRADIEALVDQLQLATPVSWIQGGRERQESVFNGLRSLPSGAQQVLIHDGARCLATPTLFDRCSAALQTCPAFVAAVPVKDTIKQVAADGTIAATPDRSTLWAAQTPQGFTVESLLRCHRQGLEQQLAVTDDAALLEAFGLPVQIVEGEETNLKVTTPADLAIAELILKQRQFTAAIA